MNELYEEYIKKNFGREGKNIIAGEGARKNTVVLDSSVIHFRYAYFDNKDKSNVYITEIDSFEGRTTCNMPSEYFNSKTIQKANKDN